jgi:predicted dinucleotide-binding enzyme
MSAKIAIVGCGNAGTALKAGLVRAGYEVRFANKTQIGATASWADVIIIAVPFSAVADVARALQVSADGKIVIDVTNALTPELELAVGFTTSGAEELQKLLPGAKVAKAFNTVFAQHMSTGECAGVVLTAFVATNHDSARRTALELARAIGFDAVDAGALKNSRSLESLAFLNIQLSWMQRMGPNIGIKLIH